MRTLLLWSITLTAPFILLAVMTGIGARRRGDPLIMCAVSAVVFPVAWVLWYVHDERPRGWRRVDHEAGSVGRVAS